MASLRNKVTLITGASSGIGAGTAKHFASLGSFLALCGRNKENLEKVGSECEKNGLPKDKILLIQGDLVNEDDCKAAVERTIEKFGQLDVLVNNAGVSEIGTIESASLEQFDRVMNINVRAVFHITMLAVPHLIKSKGSIVNVSSLAAKRAFQHLLVYTMSKAAVEQFTNCIALELAPKQVRVNAVVPGFIASTDILRSFGLTDEQVAKSLEHSKSLYPIGRLGEVEDVVKAITFFASDNASFITATLLPVDGGIQAACPR
ncbi:3-oxoacyl-[acyl-carrier-protein] reductase FabG-like [Glandiceps talaboti]